MPRFGKGYTPAFQNKLGNIQRPAKLHRPFNLKDRLALLAMLTVLDQVHPHGLVAVSVSKREKDCQPFMNNRKFRGKYSIMCIKDTLIPRANILNHALTD